MSAHNHDPHVPKAAVIGMGALVGVALLLVAAVRTGIVPPSASPVAERTIAKAVPTASRDLIFVDTAEGAVAARDARTGVIKTAVAANSETGFIRGVMRGLARDRMLREIDPKAPFRLTRWSNNDLTLTDPQTGRTIELGSFGQTNRASFEVLL